MLRAKVVELNLSCLLPSIEGGPGHQLFIQPVTCISFLACHVPCAAGTTIIAKERSSDEWPSISSPRKDEMW